MTTQLRTCALCEEQYDPRSPEKKRAGGLITHCPDCSEESATKYVGVGDGCGKQTNVQILSFDSNQDRSEFTRYWAAATGMHNGKSCHFSYLPSPIKQKFTKHSEHGGNTNHKGKDE